MEAVVVVVRNIPFSPLLTSSFYARVEEGIVKKGDVRNRVLFFSYFPSHFVSPVWLRGFVSRVSPFLNTSFFSPYIPPNPLPGFLILPFQTFLSSTCALIQRVPSSKYTTKPKKDRDTDTVTSSTPFYGS